MLKIKENIDYKTLKKYGFEKINDYFDDYIIKNYKFYIIIGYSEYMLIGNDNEIVFYCDDKYYDFILDYPDVLFDLIQDGLVEKVND